MTSSSNNFFFLARTWARAGEYDSALIVLKGLWKNSSDNRSEIFEALVEIEQKKNVLQAYALLSEVIVGGEPWHEFWELSATAEKALYYEWHAQLAFSLKDELTALDSLRRAAALGRDNLCLWALMSLLECALNEIPMALKSFHRSLEIYLEPPLLTERSVGIFLSKDLLDVNEAYFANLSFMLIGRLALREKLRLCEHLSHVFAQKDWVAELQEIVAKEFAKQPIGTSGELYASTDKENR